MLIFRQQATALEAETADSGPILAGLLSSAVFMRIGQGDIRKTTFETGRIRLVSKVVATAFANLFAPDNHHDYPGDTAS